MSPTLVSLLMFTAVVLTVFSVGSLLADVLLPHRTRASRRLQEEFNRGQRDRIRDSSLFKDLRKTATHSLEEAAEPKLTLRGRIERMLEQSGMDWTLQKLLLLCGGAATGLALPLGLVFANPFIALGSGVVGGWIPLLYVQSKRNRRLEALRAQLPESYDLMARGLRAGQTIPQTMQGVADEFPQPIAGEFLYCYEQQNLGLSPELALRDLARRTGLMEVNIFVVAVLVQRQVGGNMAEMLEKLAFVVRERYRMRGTIRTLTAEGRMQAALLMALPVFIFATMLFLNPTYAVVLFEYPLLLAGVLGSMGLGGLWIRKIINFDF